MGKSLEHKSVAIALHLAQPSHTAGRQADEMQVNFKIFKIGYELKLFDSIVASFNKCPESF